MFYNNSSTGATMGIAVKLLRNARRDMERNET